MTEYANPNALVDTDWLADHLTDTDIRIVECDEDVSAYERNHIPGAVSWNWTSDLHAPVGRDYLDQEHLSGLLSASSITADTTVILYGGNNNWFAAYAYWILKYLGYDNVKLLNGGRKKWELEGREMTTAEPNHPATDYIFPISKREELRAYRDEVMSKIGAEGIGMVDVRSPEEYRGEKLAPDHLPQEQSQVPGHIAGAANIPWVQAANEDGTFKSVEDLRKLYESRGITDDKEIIAYCRIGERSSHTWFALQELLGYQNVKNYDGSWTEYGSLVGAPVEMGGEGFKD